VISGADFLRSVQPLTVPALQNLVHIGPVQSAGVKTGALIGHGNHFILHAQIQPGIGITLLCCRQIPSVDLQNLHQPSDPGLPLILHLDKGSSLLNGINPPLCPGIGLLLNAAQADAALSALLFCPCLAVAYQDGDHIIVHAQIANEAQKDLQFLCIQGSAQQPLHLFVQTLEGRIIVHHLIDILVGIGRPLTGDDYRRPFLGKQSQLPQHRCRTVQAGTVHIQVLFRCFQAIAALQVYVQQRSIRAGCRQVFTHIGLSYGYLFRHHR